MKNHLCRISVLLVLLMLAATASCQTRAVTRQDTGRAAIRASGLRNEDPSRIEMTVVLLAATETEDSGTALHMQVLKVHKAGRDAEQLISGVDSLRGRVRVLRQQADSTQPEFPFHIGDTLYVTGRIGPIRPGTVFMEIIRCKKQ